MLRLNRIHRNNFLSACFLIAGLSIGISACAVFDTRDVTQESETTSDSSGASLQTESQGNNAPIISDETQKTDSSGSQIPTASLLFQTHERTDSIDLKLTRGVLSQQEMNHLSYEIYQDWEETMNQLLESLKEVLSAEEYEDLLSAQENWIKQRKASMDEAGKEAEGGSLQPLLENSTGFSLTRARCYELARNFGPDFTFELIKTYGLTDHTSDLAFLPEENSVTEEDDWYIVTYRLAKPVQIPSDMDIGDSCSFCRDETNNIWETITYNGEVFLGENGEEYYYYLSDETDETITLYCGSDDRVDCVFYTGELKIRKDAIYCVAITGEKETVTKEMLDNGLYFNSATFDDDGFATTLTFYGD